MMEDDELGRASASPAPGSSSGVSSGVFFAASLCTPLPLRASGWCDASAVSSTALTPMHAADATLLSHPRRRSLLTLPAVLHRLRAALLAHECAAHLGLLPPSEAPPAPPAGAAARQQPAPAEVVAALLEATAAPALGEAESYERLEVLGDSFLKLALACSVFLQEPEFHEVREGFIESACPRRKPDFACRQEAFCSETNRRRAALERRGRWPRRWGRLRPTRRSRAGAAKPGSTGANLTARNAQARGARRPRGAATARRGAWQSLTAPSLAPPGSSGQRSSRRGRRRALPSRTETEGRFSGKRRAELACRLPRQLCLHGVLRGVRSGRVSLGPPGGASLSPAGERRRAGGMPRGDPAALRRFRRVAPCAAHGRHPGQRPRRSAGAVLRSCREGCAPPETTDCSSAGTTLSTCLNPFPESFLPNLIFSVCGAHDIRSERGDRARWPAWA